MLVSEELALVVQDLCDRLQQGTAALFLGAGVNAGCSTTSGRPFPMGHALAEEITIELLKEGTDYRPSLKNAAAMAESTVGRSELDRFVYDQLSSAIPGEAHLSLVQIPWNAVFTTNYDQMVEMAAEHQSVQPVAHFVPIVSMSDDVSELTDGDIPYYKLHGSIETASTSAGRLLLTPSDYRDFDRHRRPMYRRLKLAFTASSCVFVGYSLSDDHILEVIEDVKTENAVLALPLSYWVTPSFSKSQEEYWRATYNIQLVRATAAEFFSELAASWKSSSRTVLTGEDLDSITRIAVDQSARFERLGNSFFVVDRAGCIGPPNAESFFRGAPPIWADVRDQVAPARTAFYSLMEPLTSEFTDKEAPPSSYLLTGAAGTGKTTLLMQAAFEFCQDQNAQVLWHIPGTPLEVATLHPRVDVNRTNRLLIFIEHAAGQLAQLNLLWTEIERLSLPVSLIICERANQWHFATRRTRIAFRPVEIDLGPLDRDEIDSILNALEVHGCLGRLAGASYLERQTHFQNVASRELLVALRELTEETSFDQYVIDEFERIPDPVAREAYGYVSALGQYDLFIRYDLLTRILHINQVDILEHVFLPTKGVLFDAEDIGFSRHNFGYRLRARHPIIASTVFDYVAHTDELKYKFFMDMVTQCDTGYPEDRQFLVELARERRLTEVIADPQRRRAIFDELERQLPESGYVLQHRSILERSLDAPDLAVEYARRALRLEPRNLHFENTLGLALVRLAEANHASSRALTYVNEAKRIFDKGVRLDPGNPFSYVGLTSVLRFNRNFEVNEDRKRALSLELLALLQDALEATGGDSIIAEQLAQQQEFFGERVAAIETLNVAMDLSPMDSRVRSLLGSYLIEEERLDEAIEALTQGVILDPNSWQIRKQLARALTLSKSDPLSVSGHYDYAVRYNPKDYFLIVEAAAFEFMAGRYDEARRHFDRARDLSMLSARQKRRKVRSWEEKRSDQRKIFKGTVQRPQGSQGYIRAEPEGFLANYFIGDPIFRDLKFGKRLQFTLMFNAFGPQLDPLDWR